MSAVCQQISSGSILSVQRSCDVCFQALSMLFSMGAKKAVREGLGMRLEV